MTKHLGSMGWITTEEVRANMACPRCKVAVGQSCIDLKWPSSRGKKNHKERLDKFRKARSVRLAALRGLTEKQTAGAS